jgi:SM-20-related protein
MHTVDERSLGELLQALSEQGWAVSGQLLAATLCEALYTEALEHEMRGDLRPATIGLGREERPEVRGDKIHWLDKASPYPAEHAFLSAMEHLMASLREYFRLGLNAYEAHFASYAAGRAYQRHVDRFQAQRGREISTVLFLNPEWSSADGGCLRIYHPEKPNEVVAEVEPRLGTFVLFRSVDIPHEVLPPRRTRYSIAGWMKNMDASEALLQGTWLRT